MANHSVKAVSSTPVLLSPVPAHSGADVIIQNNSAVDIFIGADDVTTTSYGFKLAANAAISLRLSGRDTIYAVSDSATTVNVLTVGLA
jgi:hypothetical protein